MAAGTQLSHLGFRLIRPSPALQPYVRSFWAFESDTVMSALYEEYMHPRGGLGMAFNFGDRVYLDGQIVGEPVFLDGATTISRKMGFFGRIDLMGISFHEGGAYPILGVPLSELRNTTNFPNVLHGESLLSVHAQLAACHSLIERIQRCEAWLMQRLLRGKQRNPIIPASLSLIRTHKGLLPLVEVAAYVNVSQRQLERLFLSQVGMSPKHYGQLQRVERARLILKQLPNHSTSYLAAELGFYDQAHFIRTFQSVIGISPYAYLQHSRRIQQNEG